MYMVMSYYVLYAREHKAIRQYHDNQLLTIFLGLYYRPDGNKTLYELELHSNSAVFIGIYVFDGAMRYLQCLESLSHNQFEQVRA